MKEDQCGLKIRLKCPLKESNSLKEKKSQMQTKCAPEENVHGLWNNSTSANAKENEIEINITNASGKANSMECESIFGLCFSHTTTKLQLDELKDLRVVCLLCTTNDILASMTYPFWHTKRRFTSPTHEHVKLFETNAWMTERVSKRSQ